VWINTGLTAWRDIFRIESTALVLLALFVFRFVLIITLSPVVWRFTLTQAGSSVLMKRICWRNLGPRLQSKNDAERRKNDWIMMFWTYNLIIMSECISLVWRPPSKNPTHSPLNIVLSYTGSQRNVKLANVWWTYLLPKEMRNPFVCLFCEKATTVLK
jgi:hypothetical protein